MRTSIMAACLALSFLLSCTASSPTGTSGVPGGAADRGDELEPQAHVSHAASLPMRLQVVGKRTGDVVELSAVLTVSGRLASPVVMSIELPAGAVVEKGSVREDLGTVPPGSEVRRDFVVRSAEGSVRVVARSVGRSSGATARVEWPLAEEPPAVRPVLEPISPVKVFGATVNKAVVESNEEREP